MSSESWVATTQHVMIFKNEPTPPPPPLYTSHPIVRSKFFTITIFTIKKTICFSIPNYTFYPVSWDTQKGDIFAHFWGVCGKSVPARVRFFFRFWCVCVPRKASHQKKEGGGTFLVKFYIGENSSFYSS